MWRFLDLVLLVAIVIVPWTLLVFALSRFRNILRKDWKLLLVLTIGLWLFFAYLLSPLTKTPLQGLFHSTPKPWFAAYTHAILTDHAAPLWLSQLGTGLPALANPYAGYMSPLTSILLFFENLDQGVNVLLLAHLVIAGVGGYLLGRSLGLSRTISLLVILPIIWNPWIYRRLSTEIHALYLYGYAWLPLTWALLVQFFRTRSFGDAIAIGIPLAFMAVSMPTVFAQASFAVAFFLAVMVLVELIRREWGELRRVIVSAVLIGAAFFLTAAPEHLAARELFQHTSGTRFESTRITGGWRDKDLSTREFFRVLLPHQLGKLVAFVPYGVDGFGIPFSPGDAVVVIAIIGVGAALRPSSGWRGLVVTHGALFTVLASTATHGLAYEPVHRIWPLWGFAGNWPVVGALLLMCITVCFGMGLDRITGGIRWGFRTLRKRLPDRIASPRIWTILCTGVLSVLGILLVTEIMWGLVGVKRAWDGTDPDGRPDLRFTVSLMDLEQLSFLPHLDYLKQQTTPAELPARVYCQGDRPVWPSPCFDYAVDRAHIEAVGSGELAWAMPSWQWGPFTRVESVWDGTVSPLLAQLLRLSAVQYLVTTRPHAYPIAAEIPWVPQPGNFQLFGRFLESSLGGLPGLEGWDSAIRIHAFPGFPRVMFTDAVTLTGDDTQQTSFVTDILSRPDFDPRVVTFLHSSAEVPPFRRISTTAASAVASSQLPKGIPRVKLEFGSSRSGAWRAEGHMPKNGVLLFSQMFYPGMRATVNGKAAPVYRANLFTSAVPVSAGDAVVTLSYTPRTLFVAGILTAVFALVLGTVTFRRNGGHLYRYLPLRSVLL